MQFSFFILCYIIDIFFIALFVSIFAPLWQQQMGLSTSQSPRLWPLFWGKSAPYGVAWYWLIDWNKNASIFPKIIRKRNNDFLETFVKHKSQWNISIWKKMFQRLDCFYFFQICMRLRNLLFCKLRGPIICFINIIGTFPWQNCFVKTLLSTLTQMRTVINTNKYSLLS